MKTNLPIQMLPACLVHTSPAVRRFSSAPCFSWVRLLSLTPCFSWVWQRPEKLNRFNGFSPLGLALVILGFLASSVQAQQPLDQTAVDSSPDSNTRVVAETTYAIAARDGNQKIWSRVTWESNSLTGDLTAKTNSFIELATA